MFSILRSIPFFLFALTTALPHKPNNGNSHSFSIQISSKYSFSEPGNITANDKLRLHQARSATRFAHPQSAGPQSGAGFLVNGTSSNVSLPTTSLSPVFLMVANVGVGTPPTTFELLVDTGSSNFVVGANPNGTLFATSASTEPTGEEVSVSYGSGFFVGKEFLDNVTIGTAAPVRQSLAVPTIAEGFTPFDGIIGLGLAALTKGTLIDEPNQTIPTITDSLFSAGSIPQDLVGLTVPLVTSTQGGSVDFGELDSSKNTSAISFTPSVTTGNTAGFWSVSQSITYGSGVATVPLVNNTPGVVDVGTSLLLFPTAAFQAYQQSTNATVDSASGLLTIEPDNVANLQSLFFTIGDNAPLEFSANAQLFPRSLISQAGLDPSMVYLIVLDGGDSLVNGYTFLERYYSVFDTTNNQVGFAYNDQTFATVN